MFDRNPTRRNTPWARGLLGLAGLLAATTAMAAGPTLKLTQATYMGGNGTDLVLAAFVDASGVVTVGGYTLSRDFPTTRGAFDRTHHGGRSPDGFVSRLNPSKIGSAQLVYSTFLGGNKGAILWPISVDASGVVTAAGGAMDQSFPTTSGAFDTTYNGGDAFVSRLTMGVALYGDVHEIAINAGGTQNLTVNAGNAHANRPYWIFGSVTGTTPGITLLGVDIPLNPDPYTDFTIGSAVAPMFVRFQGTLDSKGEATASFKVPSGLPTLPGFTLYHAYLVVDNSGIYMASNAVPLVLK